MTADEIIAKLGLVPHPEGGWYAETWRADTETDTGSRATATAIYFLLKAGERSHWHKVDAAEIWLWHDGDPLELRLSDSDDGPGQRHILGPDLDKGQAPQILVPPGHWQAATAMGAYTLVSCVVSPGFEFSGFTLAAPGFDISMSDG